MKFEKKTTMEKTAMPTTTRGRGAATKKSSSRAASKAAKK